MADEERGLYPRLTRIEEKVDELRNPAAPEPPEGLEEALRQVERIRIRGALADAERRANAAAAERDALRVRAEEAERALVAERDARIQAEVDIVDLSRVLRSAIRRCNHLSNSCANCNAAAALLDRIGGSGGQPERAALADYRHAPIVQAGSNACVCGLPVDDAVVHVASGTDWVPAAESPQRGGAE